MIHKDYVKHYIKYIIKNTFGKRGLKHLQLTYSASNIYVKTNIFNFNGFLVSLYVSRCVKNEDYYNIHILFFKKHYSHNDIRSMLNDKDCKSKYNFYYKYEIDTMERICSISYKPLMVENFYKTVNYIYENLDFTHSNGQYKHTDYSVKIEGINIKTREINTDLDVISKLDLFTTIKKYNEFKKLDLKNVVLNINGKLDNQIN